MFLLTQLFSLVILGLGAVDDIAAQFMYYRLLEHGILVRFRSQRLYTEKLFVFFIASSVAVLVFVGKFGNANNFTVAFMQTAQLCLVSLKFAVRLHWADSWLWCAQLYFTNTNRANDFVAFNEFVTGDPKSMTPAREFFNKLVPVDEDDVRELCITKAIGYQKHKRAALRATCHRCCTTVFTRACLLDSAAALFSRRLSLSFVSSVRSSSACAKRKRSRTCSAASSAI